MEYTLGPEIHHNPYHIGIIRSQLTRNLGALFPDVREEIVASFNDIIPAKDGSVLIFLRVHRKLILHV